NGMYAFAVWDEQEQVLFLARDRMGQKPLFYAMPPASRSETPAIGSASELSALVELPWVDRGLSASSLADYLLVGYVPAPRTIYTGVSKLQPGHWMRVSAQSVELREYFDAGGFLAPSLPPEWRHLPPAQQARRLIEQAVSPQLVSDVPLG